MALQKLTYTDGVTVIPASNLNAIQDAIIALENKPDNGVSDDLKVALLQLASKVAYIDDQGQQYYDDLYDALYPPKTLVSITAVFTQGSTIVYDNASLDSLKTMLAVTAHYDDNTTAIVPDNAYTLSGTLTPGTSTVTVTYNSLTTTFTVTVTAAPTLSSISAVYTQSGTVYDTDSLDSLKSDLVVTAVYSDSSTATVVADAYTLSGELTEGTSTITVSYDGKTTTFSVTVSSPNFTAVGNPSISGTVLSPSDGNFVKTPSNFSPGNSSWRAVAKVKLNSALSTSPIAYADIFGGVDSSNASIRTMMLEFNGDVAEGCYAGFIASSLSSWNIAGNGSIWGLDLKVPNWQWYELKFDGTQTYSIGVSSDGETYTTVKSVTSTNKVLGGYPVGFGLERNGVLNGDIDLAECKIYIDGSVWWEAYPRGGA